MELCGHVWICEGGHVWNCEGGHVCGIVKVDMCGIVLVTSESTNYEFSAAICIELLKFLCEVLLS